MKVFKDSSGLSPIIAFAFVLIILSFLYMAYQVYVVPTICANVEVKTFLETQNDFVAFANEVQRAISTGSDGEFFIKMGSTYPEIPFFVTLKGFTGIVYSYPIEIRIRNAVAVNDELKNVWSGDEKIYDGVGLAYEPVTFFSGTRSEIIYEVGVVAIGKQKYAPLNPFKPIQGNTIILPILLGNVSYSGMFLHQKLHVYSGGGGFVEVTDDGNPITILIKSRLPLEFWRNLLSNEPKVTNVATTVVNGTKYVEITLARGENYKLVMGAVSFEDEGRAPPHYLVRISPKAVTCPSKLEVEVRDLYNNPTPNVIVTYRSLNGSTILTNGVDQGTTVSAKSTEIGRASVVAVQANGEDEVVASLTRSDGSTYEVVFYVVG